jgi:uncharacterized hydrophobic protein (TIGR00271 family)
MKYYLIYEDFLEESFNKDISNNLENFDYNLLKIQDAYNFPFEKDDILILYLSEENIYSIFELCINKTIKCTIIPHKGILAIIKEFGIETDVKKAIEHIFSSKESKKVNVLYCNNVPIFSSAKIGDMFLFDNSNKKLSLFSKLKMFLEKIKFVLNTPFHPYLISKEGQKIIDTCAMGISIFPNYKNSTIAKFIGFIDNSDGFYTTIFAPRSIMEVLRFFFFTFILRIKTSKSPNFISYIKSNKLEINSTKDILYIIDKKEFINSRLEFELLEEKLDIIPGANFDENYNKLTTKSLQKIQNLPTNESRLEYLNRHIPWFKKASTEDFKELFDTLRRNATLSQEFIVLLILATLIASFGLLANSAPVIIGAMILAPLMAPIISASMGLVRQDKKLLSTSLRTLLIGTISALFFGFLSSRLLPLEGITQEIKARMSPNLVDLLIAICSGIAAAYVNSKEKISQSLAGVAIAVALVPPLAVSGIGIGWWNMSMFQGAFLLYITNLAGIILASGLTFIFLGYSPFHRAKKGIFPILITAIILCIPLGISFNQVIYQRTLSEKIKQLNFENIEIKTIQISMRKELYIYLNLTSEDYLTTEDIQNIQTKIEEIIDIKPTIEFSNSIIRKNI